MDELPEPWSILKLMEVIEDVVPPGVINVVTGPGAEIGKALAANPRIAMMFVQSGGRRAGTTPTCFP